MIDVRSIASVYRFELRRAATVPRMAWWVALAGFPVLLSLLVNRLVQDDPPPSNELTVVRVDVSDFSKGGMPTLTVDGKELTGIQALAYVQKLGQSDMEDAVREQLRRLGFDPTKANPGMPPPQPRRKPILIVKHPDGLDPESRPVQLFQLSVERSFERVVLYPASEEEPNVQPPSPLLMLWGTGLFILLPTVVSMLGVFLWATPAVAAELERRSWIYLATRPNGPTSVLIGKYLVGVTWGITAALAGTAMCVYIADLPQGFMHLFKPLAFLVLVGCPAYGAVYTLIGAIMPRRAMVIAVVYSLVFEGVISLVPALINKVTVQFRLRSLMVRWLGLDRIPESSTVLSTLGFNETSTAGDVTALVLITAVALSAAVFVLRWKELSQADESDT